MTRDIPMTRIFPSASSLTLTMNGNSMAKNLPLKKRRAYLMDPSNQHENLCPNAQCKEDSLQFRLNSSNISPSPPGSPHVEYLRQQYGYLLANATNTDHPPYHSMVENHRTSIEHEEDYQRTSQTIDEHFRKSLGDNYEKFTGGFLTPDESSSSSSPTERTPVDTIEEHFARSLAKFWPLNASSSLTTESVVDDHFAKALGASTWERLKEKS